MATKETFITSPFDMHASQRVECVLLNFLQAGGPMKRGDHCRLAQRPTHPKPTQRGRVEAMFDGVVRLFCNVAATTGLRAGFCATVYPSPSQQGSKGGGRLFIEKKRSPPFS